MRSNELEGCYLAAAGHSLQSAHNFGDRVGERSGDVEHQAVPAAVENLDAEDKSDQFQISPPTSPEI